MAGDRFKLSSSYVKLLLWGVVVVGGMAHFHVMA